MPVFMFTVVHSWGGLMISLVIFSSYSWHPFRVGRVSSRGFVGMRRRHIRAGYTLGALHDYELKRGDIRVLFCRVFDLLYAARREDGMDLAIPTQ
ncbi:hypothetical protein F5B17DRAFT_409861 [Nemania serpens]|nr:hypothetical protein F5B17DRAFT_409861 [Nemania serpens]